MAWGLVFRMKNKKPDPKTEILEREERLRELTDQSLQFLDQLAESRQATADATTERDRLQGDVKALQQHCADLSQQLTDARRRVRISRSLRGVGRLPGVQAKVDIVFWVPEIEENQEPVLDVDWLASSLKDLGEKKSLTGLSLVCPPRLDTESLGEPRFNGLTLLTADRTTPGQVFNLGMASSDAPVVLFLASGAKFDMSALGRLSDLADEGVALGQPLIVQGESRLSMGLEERGIMRMARRSVDKDSLADLHCDFVAPEAFVISRAAFSRIDLFDEDLLGPSVLIDYSLRARARNFTIVGMPGVRAVLPKSLDLLQKMPHESRDRLVILARHQQDKLGVALSSVGLLWLLPEKELRALLRAVFARIPDANNWPEGQKLLTNLAASIARSSLSSGLLDEHLSAMETAIDQLNAVPGVGDSPRLRELATRVLELVQVGIGSDQASDVPRRFEAILSRLHLEIEAKSEQLVLDKEVQNDLEGREFQEAHIVQIEEKIRISKERVKAYERQVVEKDLRADLMKRENEHLLERASIKQKQLEDALGRISEYEQQLDALADIREHGDEIQSKLAFFEEKTQQLGRERSALERERSALEAELGERRKQLSAYSEQAGSLRGQIGVLRKKIEQDSEGLDVISLSLGVSTGITAESIAEQIRLVRAELASRNDWIVYLLAELQRRNFSLKRRKLEVHELNFLQSQGWSERDGRPEKDS